MPEPLDTDTMTRAQHDEDLARAALLEITPAATVGELTGRETGEGGVVTLTFAAAMPGYPGWHWTVSLGEVDGFEPTVLEAELLPGDGALLAPDWVPWSVRLEEYRAAQAAAGEADETAAEEGDEDDLDLDDLGDDPDDGIDFEGHLADPEVGSGEADDDLVDPEPPLAELSPSGLPPVDVDEQQQAEAQSDEDGPQPPRRPRRQNRRQKQE